MKILITGGMGFVGSRLALLYREKFPAAEIVCFDNLKRRGSERNIETLQQKNIRFVHGDIRKADDFQGLGNFDLFVEASAEPSVHAGLDGSPSYVVETNLFGTFHCLEFARKHAKRLFFLSTSRVYSLSSLKNIALEERGPRFVVSASQLEAGVSADGISEEFSTRTARSLYGSTKLASELLIQEYVESFGLEAVINRCGVIAGPGQFGKVDQGVFTLWLAHHYFGKPLEYRGWNGKGLQVRDILHPADLFQLLDVQNEKWNSVRGEIFNAGGGEGNAVSLQQWTSACEEVVGKKTLIRSNSDTAAVDIPYYVSDNSKITKQTGWKPKINALEIARDIANWLKAEESLAKAIFGG